MYNEFYVVDNVCVIYWLEFKASIYISLLMLRYLHSGMQIIIASYMQPLHNNNEVQHKHFLPDA